MTTNSQAFLAKDIKNFYFGTGAIPNTGMTVSNKSLEMVYFERNPVTIINLVGDPDGLNPTRSAAFAKSFQMSGNELSASNENLLGDDPISGSQNQEVLLSPASLQQCELTILYRNNVPLRLNKDSVVTALATYDNGESSATGKMFQLFRNIRVTHVGSLTRNSEGFMEQIIRFNLRGGRTADSTITVTSGSQTLLREVVGFDYAEEVRTA